MQGMYSNRSSITTTESGEVFLTFYMDMPQFGENGEHIGKETISNQTIVMSVGAYESFKAMLDDVKGEKEECKL